MKNKLSKRISFIISGILGLCLVLLAVVVLIAKQHDLRLEYEETKSSKIAFLKTALSEPLYTYNQVSIENITNSFFEEWNRTVVKIEVFDSNGTLFFSKSDANLYNPLHELDKLEKAIVFNDKTIGKVVVYSDYSYYQSIFKKWALGLILYTVFVITILNLFFFFMLNKLIGKPLFRLTKELEKLQTNDYSAKIKEDYRDELKDIAEAFNVAIEKIKDRDEKINLYAQSLEVMVEKRTMERDEQKIKAVNAARLASIGEMSAQIAHEINNPLTVIDVLAFQMTRKHGKDSSEELPDEIIKLQKIRNMVERIQKIITSVKKISRDGHNEEYRLFPLNEFLESIKDLTSFKMLSSDIEFRLINQSSITELYGQEIPLSQVIINLINNAVDAISVLPKPRFIECRIYDKNNRVYFSIKDSGNGIPLEIRKKMLNPFFTTKESSRGTGLGLSISLEIIRAHQGELYYVEGSTHTEFEFYLPKDVRKS